MKCKVSAYVPCFNNVATIESALVSLREQTVPVGEIFVVDDGSNDGSAETCERLGFTVLRHRGNRGRGATRATAMAHSSGDFVLCCDATNILPPDFLECALPWFSDSAVAAVFGRIVDPAPSGVAGRWRARHLFKADHSHETCRRALLITTGSVVRATSILRVGGYNTELRHSEDSELGSRLLFADFEVVFDPSLHIHPQVANNLPKVLERYWRWHAGKDEVASWHAYLKQIVYSAKVMVRMDVKARDMASIPVSLISPHYQFWRSWLRRRLSGQAKK